MSGAASQPEAPDAPDSPAASRSSHRLAVRGLACRRGERTLFDGFDLDLSAGDLVWLRAANGVGKTTLLRVLCGLAQPERGSVRWLPDGAPAHDRVRPLYLAHANALKDDLTVLESVRHLVRLHRLGAPEAAIGEAVGRFGLHGRRHAPVRSLSQGQRRRVALTRLCLSEPHATWILDEPYDALDTDGVALVGALLAAHAARGGSVLFTSHVAPAIDGVAVRTVRLDAAAAA